MSEGNEQKAMWALIELFGHQRIAGKVSESEIGSGDLVRVDVPSVDSRPALTKYYNVKAIYGITPVDEATATRMAKDIRAEPVSEYSIEREIERLRRASEIPGQMALANARDDDPLPF